MLENLQQSLQNTLEALDIVAEVKIEKEFAVNPETRRRQVVDAKFIIYPRRAFTHEQVKSNAHAKRLEGAVEGEGDTLWLNRGRATSKISGTKRRRSENF